MLHARIGGFGRLRCANPCPRSACRDRHHVGCSPHESLSFFPYAEFTQFGTKPPRGYE
jgi:hypothetical protein